MCILMFCGGTAMIVELIKKIKYRNTKKKENNEVEELLNKNEELWQLVREYATNEHSLENIVCYERMKQYSNDFKKMDKVIPLSELLKFEEEFIQTYSSYELNVPGTTKKKFYELLESCRMMAPSESSISSTPSSPISERLSTAERLSTFEKPSNSRSNSNADLLIPSKSFGVTFQQLSDVIYFEIMLNISDTFSRLQRTAQYQEWESIYSMQLENKTINH